MADESEFEVLASASGGFTMWRHKAYRLLSVMQDRLYLCAVADTLFMHDGDFVLATGRNGSAVFVVRGGRLEATA
jgi:hypothetical protein